ncbi:MAG TPA: NAD(P)/FAD-dependent oxidoreductase [Pseudomonadales bacterium]
MAERRDVLIVGAGFAGMYAIYRFRKQGLKALALEAGSDVGGTWYWNRYPGARCDVPSLEYSYGFSEELEQEWEWPEVFSAQPDILRYANHVADKFDLRRDIRFDTRVTAVTWLNESSLWQLTTESGQIFEAPFCVMATGCLSVPNTPDFPGAERFEGLVLHTGRWPKHEPDLAGLRIGIIGTGSSGVQAIPELARTAGHLTVFQRTPVYTVPANRKAMRKAVEDDFKAHYPEIREMQQSNPGGVSNYRPFRTPSAADVPAPSGVSALPGTEPPATVAGPAARARSGMKILDLTPDQRRELVRTQGLGVLLTFRDAYTDLDANEAANEAFREGIRGIVHDPKTADALCPTSYGLGCKRQVLDRDYYDTFNRDNVTLVDVQAAPIEAITATGLKTTDAEYHFDVLIYATGFDAMTGALLGANLTGRDGRRLSDKWAHGPITYLGLALAGFPNLFTVTGPGSPSVLCNMLVAIEQHVNWIGEAIDYVRGHGYSTIEALAEAEDQWVAHVNQVAEGTMYTSASCNSWYLGANIPGKPRIFMPYVGGYPRYRARCEEVARGAYEGFQLA